jgi:hypothetical protein
MLSMKQRQKWAWFSVFVRICTGSHKFDLPCSGSQGSAVLILQIQRGISHLLSHLGSKTDVELYWHAIAWNIQPIFSNCEEVHYPNGPSCISRFFSGNVHIYFQQNKAKRNYKSMYNHMPYLLVHSVDCGFRWRTKWSKSDTFRCSFVFDYFWNLISRWVSASCMRVFEIKLLRVVCYDTIKFVSSLARQNLE